MNLMFSCVLEMLKENVPNLILNSQQYFANHGTIIQKITNFLIMFNRTDIYMYCSLKVQIGLF